MMTFPTEWSHKIPWFQSTSQLWISCMDSVWIYRYIYLSLIYIYISYIYIYYHIYIYIIIYIYINIYMYYITHIYIYIYISYHINTVDISYHIYIYISYISCMVVSIRFNWFHVPKPGCPSHKIGTLQDHEAIHRGFSSHV